MAGVEADTESVSHPSGGSGMTALCHQAAVKLFKINLQGGKSRGSKAGQQNKLALREQKVLVPPLVPFSYMSWN